MSSLIASDLGKAKIQQARNEKGWNVDDPKWLVAASKVLKQDHNWEEVGPFANDISAGTWKAFLYRMRGIRPHAFKAYCQVLGLDWEEVVERNSTQQTAAQADFFAYDAAWVGRETLIEDLSNQLQGSCRVLILVGITGIGKTALAERLAVELQDGFEGDWTKHRVNFDHEKQLDFASVAAKLLEEKWGENLTPDERKDPQRLLYKFLKSLRENRYLVLMDSLEKLLPGNEGDFADEWWGKIFQSLFSAESCQSRLILTSQDLPVNLVNAGSRYPNFWYPQPLKGLSQLEQEALFEKTQLEVSLESPGRPLLLRIGCAYGGHPLALRAIAGEIVNDFKANVLAYWEEYGREIEEVEKALEEACQLGKVQSADDQWKLDRYSAELQRRVQVRLEATFERLKKSVYRAYVLLCAASVYRCPVNQRWWLKHLGAWLKRLEHQECSEEQQKEALQALRDRYLVEEAFDDNNHRLLGQHNLIRSVAIEHREKLLQIN